MGGGFYDCDVALEARSSQSQSFSFRGHVEESSGSNEPQKVHPALDPYGKARECNNQTPIIVALDVTRSRGEDTKIVYEKLPMFIGQIIMKDYVPGPAISFAAIGDATDGDKAPLQVGQFEADNRLDEVLGRFWIEEGGGGSGQESYELAAYFYNRTNLVQHKQTGKKAFCFFIGDEGYYPTVSREQVKEIIGDDIPEDLDSVEVFRQLQERFHVFFIYPKKSWKERKQDIDAEIRKRVQEAGGQYDGVDIRASLIWNDRNDLDLHVITPSGEKIYYGNKRSRCGGWLDVDMNVRGETTKPVENIRWRQGEAPKGTYQVIVQNYAFHERKKKSIPFRVELEVNGEIQHFEGAASNKGETGSRSDVLVTTFEYAPKAATPEEHELERYDGYRDEVIMEQWKRALPEENILLIEEPHAILDVMMGALAMVEGTGSLEQVIGDLRDMGQSVTRQEQVARALEPLSRSLLAASVTVEAPVLGTGDEATAAPKRTRRKRTTRLNSVS